MPHFTNSICPSRGDQIQTHHTVKQITQAIQITSDQLRNKICFSITYLTIYSILLKLPFTCRLRKLMLHLKSSLTGFWRKTITFTKCDLCFGKTMFIPTCLNLPTHPCLPLYSVFADVFSVRRSNLQIFCGHLI